METTKLISLAGLATGGVSAVSGSATSLVGTGLFSGNSVIRTGTQIKDLDKSSKTLFQKTHLECVKDLFPGLGALDKLKEDIGATETTDNSFNLSSVATSSGPVNGCLTVDANYYEKKETPKNQGAMAATIELAATKGNYGIILLNSIGNIFEDTKYHFEYRLFFLKKDSGNWKIQTGLQLHDPQFVNGGTFLYTLLWSGLNDLNLSIVWQTQLCQTLSNCQALEGPAVTKKSYLKLFRWTSPTSSNKNLWQGLQIKNIDTTYTTTGYDQYFWDGSETPLTTTSQSNLQPTGIFKDGTWKKPKDTVTVDPAAIKSWLEIFKSDKGEWKARQ